MSFRQLSTVLNGCIKGGNLTRALRLLVTNLPRSGNAYALRRYVAEILAGLGKEREAAEIYEILVRHFANSGEPLVAVAVAQQLGEFEPDLSGHLDHIASVYCRTSPFLEPHARLEQHNVEAAEGFDLGGSEPDLPLEALAGVAHEIALRKDGFASSPDSVPPIPLLSSLDKASLRKVLDRVVRRPMNDEESVTTAGAKSSRCAWLVRGELTATRPGGSGTSTVKCGAMFGHRALMPNFKEPCEVDLIAAGDVELLVLTGRGLKHLQEDPDVIRAVASFDLACRVERALARCKVFDSVPEQERYRLLRTMDARALPGKTVILPQGEQGPGFFLVVEGKVAVTKSQGDFTKKVATAGPGELVGHPAMIHEDAAEAQAMTDGPCRLLYMSRSNFKKTCDIYPDVMSAVRTQALAADLI